VSSTATCGGCVRCIAGSGPGGLIIGYAILGEAAIAEGGALLATAIREVRGS
jgi:GntR family transcriptional regulator/MocR family aminotransferase